MTTVHLGARATFEPNDPHDEFGEFADFPRIRAAPYWARDVLVLREKNALFFFSFGCVTPEKMFEKGLHF